MTKRKKPEDLKPRPSLENTDPEKFADFLVQFTEDPECNVSALARRCGLPQRTAAAIVKRMQTTYLPVLQEVEKVTTKTLLKKIETALPLILDRMADDDLLKTLTMRDAAVASGVLIEKRQLLRGEPTQIMTLEERKSMKELTPALISEMKKRSLTIDVEYEDIPPEGPEDPHVWTRTLRQQAKREDRGRV